jgi:hypothetical protein
MRESERLLHRYSMLLARWVPLRRPTTFEQVIVARVRYRCQYRSPSPALKAGQQSVFQALWH